MPVVKSWARAGLRTNAAQKLRTLGHISATLAFALVAACSTTTDNTPTGTTPAIAVAVGTLAAVASPGIPASVPITVVRSGGFTGDVALVAEGLPTGVTAVFTPASLTQGATSSVLTLSLGATAVASTATVTVRATGSGVTAATATVSFTASIPANPSIGLVAGASTVSIPQGQTGTVALTLDRQGGFAGTVTLAAEGLPANVTPTFSPANFGAGVTSSTLTFSVGSAAVAGVTNVTVRATGTGVTDKTVVVQLTITSSATPDFTLTATPAALSVVPGAGAQSVINLARTGGFAGNVTFTTSTLPTGVTATFTPNPAPANTSTLAFTTTAATPGGTYTITVTGSATGQTARTVSVVLTVSALPSVTIALSSTSATVAAGASAATTVTLTRNAGLTGDVTVAVDGALPAGVTVAFAPASPVAGTTTTATISTTTAVAAGAYTITLRATGTGGVTTTAAFTLTVTAAPGFTVVFTSGVTSIAVGGTGSLTANITRTGGFAGAVNFAVTGLPAGITATPSPAAATGASTTINLSVAAGTAAGTYNGTLTGTSPGLAGTATPFSVTVTGGGGGGGGNIQWVFCDATRIPLFFAFRDGSTGAWTRVTPSGGTFSFTINQSVGGVSYVLPNSSGFATSVFLQTAAELTAAAASECTSFPTGGKTVSGSVAGLGFFQNGAISLGNATASTSSANPVFTLNNVANGALDLVASRSGFNQMTFVQEIDRIIIRRGLNQANGSIIPVIDFGAAEAFAPVSANATISNGGADQLIVQSLFNTATGSSASLFSAVTGAGAVRAIFGVPSARLVAGDLHQVLVSAIESGTNAFRGVYSYFRDIADKAITLGASLTIPTVTSSTSTVLRPRAQAAFQAEYQTAFGASFIQATGNRTVTVNASKGYFGSGTSYDLEVPDLAPVSGFNTTWGLSPATATTYSLSATGLSGTAIVDGSSWRFAARSGNVP